MMLDKRLLTGALLILGSELFLVLSGMVIKQISGDLPTEVIVFFRNAFGLVLLIPWFLKHGNQAIRTQLLRYHFMRAAVGVSAMSCLYYAWGHLPLAQAALLKQTSPFFVPFFAFWWLNERINRYAIYAILIGFVGVYIVLNPHGSDFNLAVLVAVLGAMLGALAKVTVRRMVLSESPQRIVFYFALFSTMLAAVPAAIVWVMPNWQQFIWLLVLAMTSTAAQLMLSKGYAYAPAGQLGPFTYGSILFATLFGWWIWDESVAIHTWLGVILIVIAGFIAMQSRAKTL
ncbi:DMT family transporter [Neptunomonas phycophila]|uniref:DMT family transporter n=1 Tax=Neptunomonas phycophila TaxID=1572645 RepID=UPI0026E360C7|nr:DMT family transporter [Neptunomonas phycophila]MDO6466927.1 DMT family transporter [Neptunomonas phycophila]